VAESRNDEDEEQQSQKDQPHDLNGRHDVVVREVPVRARTDASFWPIVRTDKPARGYLDG
jgi:hypothetical protein